MATSRQRDIAESLGISPESIDAFLKRHQYFLETGADFQQTEGPTGVFTKSYPNWPLFKLFAEHTIGKPATAEPKPEATDPFKELASEALTDEEIAAAIAPTRKLPPPPEPEE